MVADETARPAGLADALAVALVGARSIGQADRHDAHDHVFVVALVEILERLDRHPTVVREPGPKTLRRSVVGPPGVVVRRLGAVHFVTEIVVLVVRLHEGDDVDGLLRNVVAGREQVLDRHIGQRGVDEGVHAARDAAREVVGVAERVEHRWGPSDC